MHLRCSCRDALVNDIFQITHDRFAGNLRQKRSLIKPKSRVRRSEYCNMDRNVGTCFRQRKARSAYYSTQIFRTPQSPRQRHHLRGGFDFAPIRGDSYTAFAQLQRPFHAEREIIISRAIIVAAGNVTHRNCASNARPAPWRSLPAPCRRRRSRKRRRTLVPAVAPKPSNRSVIAAMQKNRRAPTISARRTANKTHDKRMESGLTRNSVSNVGILNCASDG